MDTETACKELRELGVIDEKLLYNAIIEQGPKREEGRLYKQQGIVYEEVKHLRLEFLEILKIDHLWMMTGLTKLQLSNNVIEKIENLDKLVNLEELDLSFNYIKKIENLENLTKLSVLTLFQNKIENLENLESLHNLTILSVGNNFVADTEVVMYLRKFEKLRSLNLAGNPVCSTENFKKYAISYLPQLKYYEYSLITKEQRENAREVFLKELVKLENEEEEKKEAQRLLKMAEDREALNAEAFVEYIGDNKLFQAMFEKDVDCKTLLQIGDAVMKLYTEYKNNMSEVTKEIVEFGLSQLEIRKAEVSRFQKYIGKGKKKAFKESRNIVEDFLVQKDSLFAQIKDVLNLDMEDDDIANEVSVSVQVLNEAFKDLCHRTWISLMKKELTLFEGTEEANSTYERALSDLVNQFIEGAQAQFTQLRQLQAIFNESLTDTANKFFTTYTVATATGAPNDFNNLPADLLYLMQDKEILMNALSASHDLHLLVIDQREDKLVSGVKSWLSNIIENLTSSEIKRHRNNLMEINHFLDIQKINLQKLILTPVGLLLLPKDIQDALEI